MEAAGPVKDYALNWYGIPSLLCFIGQSSQANPDSVGCRNKLKRSCGMGGDITNVANFGKDSLPKIITFRESLYLRLILNQEPGLGSFHFIMYWKQNRFYLSIWRKKWRPGFLDGPKSVLPTQNHRLLEPAYSDGGEGTNQSFLGAIPIGSSGRCVTWLSLPTDEHLQWIRAPCTGKFNLFLPPPFSNRRLHSYLKISLERIIENVKVSPFLTVTLICSPSP